jgi:hypothetical protein
MQLSTILPALLSGLSFTNALPTVAPPTWQASNFTLNCSPGGCIYSFNITGARSENTPAFSTHCEGKTPNATLCLDKNITARVKPLGNPLWNVWVEHEWHILQPGMNSEQTYWQSGSTNVTEHTKNFRIMPDLFYGVA